MEECAARAARPSRSFRWGNRLSRPERGFMPRLPKISVITPSFNSIHTIRETIESVQAQDFPNCEHLIIDGGSTDGTLDVLREYPRLKWTSEKDEGHYHAMNKGVERASGE